MLLGGVRVRRRRRPRGVQLMVVVTGSGLVVHHHVVPRTIFHHAMPPRRNSIARVIVPARRYGAPCFVCCSWLGVWRCQSREWTFLDRRREEAIMAHSAG